MGLHGAAVRTHGDRRLGLAGGAQLAGAVRVRRGDVPRLLVLAIVSAIPNLGRFLPPGLLEPAGALANGTATAGSLGADLAVPVVATVVFIAACIGVAASSFRRQEL
jgi:hypothetical protein